MPLIGNPITASFQARPATEEFNGNGSTTTFTLGHTVTQEDILVSVDGVIQESVDAFTVPDGTTLTFTAAPSSGTGNIFVIYMGVSAASVTPAAENKGQFKGSGMFRTNEQSPTSNITILATENANVTGTLTMDSGVTLSVESGGTLVTL